MNGLKVVNWTAVNIMGERGDEKGDQSYANV